MLRITSRILIVLFAVGTICAARASARDGAAQFGFTTSVVQQPSGQLMTTGKVKVDGHEVGNGFTLNTGSTTTTAKGSSAVVSLGKLGRVEVFPNSSVKLDFDNGGIKIKLEAGRVRISSGSGVSASVSTKDGEVIGDTAQEDSFTVDTECGNTIVSTQSGKVELRAGGTVKQIAAGSQDSAGTAKPGRCKSRRP